MSDSQSSVKRPYQVTVLGWFFVVVSVAALIYHLATAEWDRWMIVMALVELIGIVGGVFLRRGANWARWLILAWIAGHAVALAFVSVKGALPHFALLIVIGYYLLGPAGWYFRASRQSIS